MEEHISHALLIETLELRLLLAYFYFILVKCYQTSNKTGAQSLKCIYFSACQNPTEKCRNMRGSQLSQMNRHFAIKQYETGKPGEVQLSIDWKTQRDREEPPRNRKKNPGKFSSFLFHCQQPRQRLRPVPNFVEITFHFSRFFIFTPHPQDFFLIFPHPILLYDSEENILMQRQLMFFHQLPKVRYILGIRNLLRLSWFF